MSNLGIVVGFAILGSLLSLGGGFLLFSSKKLAARAALYATPFAAGALLAAAFLDLLGEAVKEDLAQNALIWALLGIVIFFLLERFLRWFHHHHEHEDSHTDPRATLVIIGDLMHNFIDGVAIAAGFLTSIEVGIVVSIAVAAHEIPQEIGDFALLLSKGLGRRKVILINLLSAVVTIISAAAFYMLGQAVMLPQSSILGLIAGFFIYIAVSDIIPSIHQQEAKKLAGLQTAMLLCGLVMVAAISALLSNIGH